MQPRTGLRPQRADCSPVPGTISGWLQAKCQSLIANKQHSAGEWAASLASSFYPMSRIGPPTPTASPDSGTADSHGLQPGQSSLPESPKATTLEFPEPRSFRRKSPNTAHSGRKSAPAALLVNSSTTSSKDASMAGRVAVESDSPLENSARAEPSRKLEANHKDGELQPGNRALTQSGSLQAQRLFPSQAEKALRRGESSRLASGSGTGSASARPELAELFHIMDLDGDGRISAEELARVLRVVGEDYSVGSVRAMIEQADSNGDGFVSLEDFERVASGRGALLPVEAEAQKEIDTPHRLSSTSFGSSIGILSSDSMRSVASTLSEVSLVAGPGQLSFGARKETLSSPLSRAKRTTNIQASSSFSQPRIQDEATLARAIGNSSAEDEVTGRTARNPEEGSLNLDEENQCPGEDDELEQLRAAFDMFDCDGNGVICEEDLFAALQRIWGDEVTWEECETIILNADNDGDGLVGFQDFVAAMRSGGGCFGGSFGSKDDLPGAL